MDWIGVLLVLGAALGCGAAIVGSVFMIHGLVGMAAQKSVDLAQRLPDPGASERELVQDLVTDARGAHYASWPPDEPRVEFFRSRVSGRWVIVTERSVRMASDRRLPREVQMAVQGVRR